MEALKYVILFTAYSSSRQKQTKNRLAEPFTRYITELALHVTYIQLIF